MNFSLLPPQARNIKNKPIVNKDKQASRIAEMQTEIQALRDELQRHRLTTANTEVVSIHAYIGIWDLLSLGGTHILGPFCPNSRLA